MLGLKSPSMKGRRDDRLASRRLQLSRACASRSRRARLRAQTADTVLFNGKILTVDKDFSVQQALAIGHGQVLATGTTAAMKKLAGDKARLIDLGGRTVIPGLTDGHIHGIRAALTFGTEVNWIGVPTPEGGAGENPPGRQGAKARLLDRGGRRLDRGAIRREAPPDRRAR